MHKFDKIKTAADKRLALDKRGKAAPVDFKLGDKLILSEKLDGFNTSLDTLGKTYSRSNELGGDMTHHKKLIPFVDLAPRVTELVKDFYGVEHDFQVFGEFMVTDRIIQYSEDLYDKWYPFDVYNLSTKQYLGPLAAREFTEFMLERDPDLHNHIIPLQVIDEAYEFTSYEDLEEYVYNQSLNSGFGEAGKMEGIVAYNYNGLRAKIVNKEFKETQRTVSNAKGHTKAVQWVNQYLTQPRLTKLVKNALIEEQLNPHASDYFTTQLEQMKEIVWQDILEESIDTPEFKGNDLKNILNKIEAKTRFTMLDEKKYSTSVELSMDDLNFSDDLKL